MSVPGNKRNVLFDLEELSSLLPPDERVTIPKSFPTDDLAVLGSQTYLRLAMKLVNAYAERMKDALTLYRPLPGDATRFHESMARIRLLNGSNQAGKCVVNGTPVLTPRGLVAIESLSTGDVVIGGDGKQCRVTGVYPQGVKDVYELVFCDGASVRCCEEHLWKIKQGARRFGPQRTEDNWVVWNLKKIREHAGDSPSPVDRVAIPTCVAEFEKQEIPLDAYVLGALLGDGSLCHSLRLTSADDEILERVRDSLPDGCDIKHASRYDYGFYGIGRSKNPLAMIVNTLGLRHKKSYEKFIPKQYLFNSVEVRLDVLRGLMDTDGSCSDRRSKGEGGTVEYCTTSPQLASDVEFLVRSLGGKCKTLWRTTTYTYLGVKKAGRPSARIRIRLPQFNPFWLKRKSERYAPPKSTSNYRILHTIKPAGRAECTCIAVDSPDRTFVTKDFIVTHNTLTAEAEFARIARGKDPFHKRADKFLKMMAVGKDARHIGQVMWRKLYWTGAFDCIVDNETGFIRSVRPDPNNPDQIDPSDAARRKEWIPSPPLIPESCIGNITWESMGEGIPKLVTLKNGTEILWCTSNGAPPNGIQLDVAHFDEELTSDRWLPETLPRLLRFGGIFFWSATPQASTPQFFDLHKRAVAGDPDIEEFTLLIENNPYLPAEAKEAFRRDMLALGDEEYQVRWKGKYAIQGREVYPTYDLKKQGIHLPMIPSDWMIVIAVDPGTAISAFVPIGVPPTADRLVVLGECEMRNKDAEGFAKELKLWLGGRRPEAYVIDKQAGCQVSMGRNDTVAEHYSKAMRDAGVPPSRLTGTTFAYGCNVPAARELSVKGLLNTGKLKFRLGHIPRLDKQIQGRYYDKVNMDRREKRTVHDLCDGMEYGVAFFDDTGIYYHEPLQPILQVSAYDERVYKSFLKKKRR